MLKSMPKVGLTKTSYFSFFVRVAFEKLFWLFMLGSFRGDAWHLDFTSLQINGVWTN